MQLGGAVDGSGAFFLLVTRDEARLLYNAVESLLAKGKRRIGLRRVFRDLGNLQTKEMGNGPDGKDTGGR